ncbi:hypothetical protein TNIN_171651, partial [Trichonephila inaurata madagascariensis]
DHLLYVVVRVSLIQSSSSLLALTRPNDSDICVPLLRYLDKTFHRVHRLQLHSSYGKYQDGNDF